MGTKRIATGFYRRPGPGFDNWRRGPVLVPTKGTRHVRPLLTVAAVVGLLLVAARAVAGPGGRVDPTAPVCKFLAGEIRPGERPGETEETWWEGSLTPIAPSVALTARHCVGGVQEGATFKLLIPESETRVLTIGAPRVTRGGEKYRLLEAKVAARGGDQPSEDVAVLLFPQPVFAQAVVNTLAPVAAPTGARLSASGFGVWKPEDLHIDEATGQLEYRDGAETSSVPRTVELEVFREAGAPGLLLTRVTSRTQPQTAPGDSGGACRDENGRLCGITQGALTGRLEDGTAVHILVTVDLLHAGLRPLWGRAIRNGVSPAVFDPLD